MPRKFRTLTARGILDKAYGRSKNFMTPRVIGRGKLNSNVAYELSTGIGINPGTKLYGVSIASASGRRLTNKSKAFSSRSAASSYINKLKSQMKPKKR